MTESTYVPCEACGALNRVVRTEPTKAPVCGRCRRPLRYRDGIVEAGERGLALLVDRSPLPVVVDFWAAWCGPCRVFAPTFADVARARFGRAVFVKVDTEAEPEAARRHGIQAIPTLVVFHRGRELARQSGALPPAAFAAFVDEAVGRAA